MKTKEKEKRGDKKVGSPILHNSQKIYTRYALFSVNDLWLVRESERQVATRRVVIGDHQRLHRRK